MTDELLTIKEVASLLRLAGKTAYSMAQRGELPGFKVRGQWRFKRTDIEAWIEAQKAEHGVFLGSRGTGAIDDAEED